MIGADPVHALPVARTIGFVLFVFGAVACSKGPPPGNSSRSSAPSAAPVASELPKPVTVVPTPSASASRPPFREEDFTESEHSRDPFRSYVSLFTERSRMRVHSERQVVVGRYSIDELRLVGLVTRTDEPRAMLVDPTGRGWVVTKGQFLGRAEVVHSATSGGIDYELNWRIDRIRDTDIVLLREDPAHPDVPPATRVISLRTEKTSETPDEMQSP